MIKWLIILVLAAGLAFLGSTVVLGKRTFFGHIQAIWRTEEVQDMKQGIEHKASPAVSRVKRGVEAGIHAASDADQAPNNGSGSGRTTPSSGLIDGSGSGSGSGSGLRSGSGFGTGSGTGSGSGSGLKSGSGSNAKPGVKTRRPTH